MKSLNRKIALVLLWLSCSGPVFAQQSPTAQSVREGHWVEVRGTFQQEGVFQAQRIEIVHSQRYEVLIGTASGSAKQNHIRVLGRDVELNEKTTYQKLSPDQLTGKRVKVEGYYRNRERFSARELAPRGPGRERLVGRADRVRQEGETIWLDVMGFSVAVPADMELDHEDPLPEYVLSQRRTQPVPGESRNEDDQFGKGIRISENILFAGLAEARWTAEDEFDLNERDPEDRQDYDGSFRGRLVYRPSSNFVGVLELTHRRLWRDDDEDGRLERDNTVLGETFAYWFDPFRFGTDIQVGRIDFDEEREWLYDQNLDGLRLISSWGDLMSEISVSTTLTDGSPLDENTLNYMFYLSNGEEDNHMAAYVIYRDTDLAITQQRTHFGVRAHGEFLENHQSWLEISYMRGEDGNDRHNGWGLDAGNTWLLDSGLNFTVAYALGQGDKNGGSSRAGFRQTGLQDNNAKLAGVTSFRYYGELVDPELSNIEIFTAGIGFRFKRRVSLDLVSHFYRQDELSRTLVDSEIDKRPNGRDRDLGWETDLILGWRTNQSWDLEVVAAYFSPGAAFDTADDALLGKFQLRYRF